MRQVSTPTGLSGYLVVTKNQVPATNAKPAMSRQRAYQKRHAAAGLCVFCPRRAFAYTLCPRHILKERARVRARGGWQAWRPGGRGRAPRYTDNALRVMIAEEGTT